MKSNIAVIAVLGLGFTSLAATKGPIKITDLGPTSTFDVTGNKSLNDRGQLAGYIFDANSHSHAALYHSGDVNIFGTLGGDAYANAINDSNEVVGYCYVTESTRHHATIFTVDGTQDLGTIGGDDSVAYAIDDEGHIAGVSTLIPGDSTTHAVIFSRHNDPIDLGTLGGSTSAALGINRRNTVVGMSLLPGDLTYHAALFAAYVPPLDLGTLGGAASWANAVNNQGLIVGYSTLADTYTKHAAVFTPGGAPTDLGTLGGSASQAMGVNDEGIIVGFADTAAGQPHGALWQRIGGAWLTTDINVLIDRTSGWTIDFAYAINNRGVIEVAGRNADNIEHTLLLGFDETHHPTKSDDDMYGFY